MKRWLLLSLLPALILAPCLAAAEPPPMKEQPVTISASGALEWNRKAQTYVARKNVVATQGENKLKSDLLTARYTDAKGATNIKTLEASGNVALAAPPYTAFGDKAVYDVASGDAVLTGSGLKITSAESTLTARQRITYNRAENKMTAEGAPLVVKGADTLSADIMHAWFEKDANGRTSARKIDAKGNVIVKTAQETVTGDAGTYDLETQKAVLTGKVRILQGQNWLEGTRADIDMNTGISRLSAEGNTQTEGRVTGTFYPESQKKQ